MRAHARAGSRIGVDARLGLPPGGGRPVGPDVRGALVSGIGSFGNAGFFGSCGNSLLLAENYNRTTTNNTTEAQSAQRLNGGGRNILRLDDPCELRANLARLPIDRAASLPWSMVCAPESAARGPGRLGRISSAGRAFLLMLSAVPLASAEGTCAEEYASEKSQRPIASSSF